MLNHTKTHVDKKRSCLLLKKIVGVNASKLLKHNAPSCKNI